MALRKGDKMESLEDKTQCNNRLSDLEKELSSENSLSFFQKVADLYFKPKSFERSGKLYESLGAKQFKKLLMGAIGGLLGGGGYASNYFIGKERSVKAIKKFERCTRINETIHLPATIILSYALIGNLVKENYLMAAADVFFGLLNGYPLILQRYNRARVYNVLEKKENRFKSS